ncbi:MAG: hypothetical protein HW402_1408 [Dehalococcoidales bacterium]|nr:hypothetical protein [Dehalococcoidales bacterium]
MDSGHDIQIEDVILAKARIQIPPCSWIPAYAGMTVFERVQTTVFERVQTIMRHLVSGVTPVN